MRTVRKIVQIAVRPEGDNVDPVLYALCDDGTLWYRQSHLTVTPGRGASIEMQSWEQIDTALVTDTDEPLKPTPPTGSYGSEKVPRV